MCQIFLVTAMVLLIFFPFTNSQSVAAQEPVPSAWVPSGDVMYKQFCAACHGAHARGNGPAASALKIQPPDLTTLAKRHGGKFPYD
jgi:mono/diheme cytochrome c family protein